MNNFGAYRRKAQNIKNVEARVALLLAGLTKPEQVTHAFFKSLESQRAFAGLSLPNKKIAPLSLNTLKVLAKELFTNKEERNGSGFDYLNSLRLQLKQVIETRPSGRSHEAKAKRQATENDDLTIKLQKFESHNISRVNAYLDLYDTINSLVKAGNMEEITRVRLLNILHAHNKLHSELFHPNEASSAEGGAVVVTLADKRAR